MTQAPGKLPTDTWCGRQVIDQTATVQLYAVRLPTQ